MKIILIGCGGFFGAISRYLVSGLIYNLLGTGLPYGTLTVNLAGSFLLGGLARIAMSSQLLNDNVTALIGIGFLGAFTTFSTFSVQTLELLESGNPGKAVLNVFLNLTLCLAGAWLGLSLGRCCS
ncbi:MAG: fluoride efflux transporter CrcB [Deltaproteobacteria bacterium]|nr:fluoride efflux transporter CrcB [Deltaproteobacteria bacterium]